MTEWMMIESCCGSAALTLYQCGAHRAVLPYQGSKWRFRKQLSEIISRIGFVGLPTAVCLTDAGPWGVVAPLIMNPSNRKAIADILESWKDQDLLAKYHEFHAEPFSADPIMYAAQFLFLQRLSFSGKAVGTKDGSWISPGFNKTSAYGTPATDKFGTVKPMIPSLITTLRAYKFDIPVLHPQYGLPAVVYIDPNYEGDKTGYPNGSMSRAEVVQMALNSGPYCMVSESEPIKELVAHGWNIQPISQARPHDGSPFKGKQEEWVTTNIP